MGLKNRINISLIVHAKVEKKVKDYVLKKLGQRFLYNPIDDGGFFYLLFLLPLGCTGGEGVAGPETVKKKPKQSPVVH